VALLGPIEDDAPPPGIREGPVLLGWGQLRYVSHSPVRHPGVEACVRFGTAPPRASLAGRWRAALCA
jgi:hypothetical protein